MEKRNIILCLKDIKIYNEELWCLLGRLFNFFSFLDEWKGINFVVIEIKINFGK